MPHDNVAVIAMSAQSITVWRRTERGLCNVRSASMRTLQVQSWFKAFLSEVYRPNRHFDQARDLAQQGLELARRIAHG
jgi:hypothetical protein